MSTHQKAIDLFISYHENDKALLQELEKHLSVLKRQGLISIWHRGLAVPGTHQDEIMNEQLRQTSIILLLVSADFLASDFYDRIEAENALERHKVGETRIVPILIRPCDWENSSLAHLAVLPDTEKPLTEWHNRDAAFSHIVAGIRRVAKELSRFTEQRASVSPPQVWNVPHRRNPLFTGRSELLDQLQQQLMPIGQNEPVKTRSVALTQRQAIKGLGGIGKTQIAVEYAYRSRDLDRYTHTLWIDAANKETIITSIVTIAELLPSFSAKNEIDQQKLVEAVKQWLERCEHPWLLIFDNVDSDESLSQLAHYFPQQGNGSSILLTTRSHAVGSLAIASISVEEMDRWEGTLFLLRRAQLFEHASIEDASDEEVDLVNAARGIVDALESFPLALEQAGAYIEETQSNLTDYLQIYQDHRADLLARRGHQITNYPETVATTWSLSFQKVEQANPAAAELLRLCAFLAPDQIPEELIREGAGCWSPLLQRTVVDLFTFGQMIEELLKFSLIKRLAKTNMLSIHRLVQAVLIDTMDKDTRSQWAKRVVVAVNDVFPDGNDVTLWPKCQRYLPQVQACSVLIEDYSLMVIEAANLLNQSCVYMLHHALYTIAEPLVLCALSIQEQQLGTEHPDTAMSLNNLAVLYQHQERYIEAEPLLVRALSIREQQSGSEHPETALSLSNLAVLYQSQKRYAEAEPLLVRALSIREQQLGAEHLETAMSLNNLAVLYQYQERYMEAEPLLVRVLSIQERQLEADHPDTATSLSNLATIYKSQGKYAQAEPLLVRALSMQEQRLGADHPDVEQSLYHLIDLYQMQDKDAEAEPLLMRVASIRKQASGPDTALSLWSFAALYLQQQQYAQAKPLYQQALTILQRTLGPDHPSTKELQAHYTSLLQTMEYEKKEPDLDTEEITPHNDMYEG